MYDFGQIVEKSQESHNGVVLFCFQGADYWVIGLGPDLVVHTGEMAKMEWSGEGRKAARRSGAESGKG